MATIFAFEPGWQKGREVTGPRITALALATLAIGVVTASTLVLTRSSPDGAPANDSLREREPVREPANQPLQVEPSAAPPGEPPRPAGLPGPAGGVHSAWLEPSPPALLNAGVSLPPFGPACDPGYDEDRPLEELTPLELSLVGACVNPYPPTFIPRHKAIGQLPESFFTEVTGHPNFAGKYIDDDGGTILVIRATGSSDYFRAIADRYAAPDLIVVVRSADYTQAELEQWQARITPDIADLRSAGILITQAGFDPVSNRLLIKVIDLTDQEAALLTDRYGGPRVKVIGGAQTTFQPAPAPRLP